jgi:hypothetical protein
MWAQVLAEQARWSAMILVAQILAEQARWSAMLLVLLVWVFQRTCGGDMQG